MGWQWHQLGHMQTICTSLQTDNHASTSPLSFYRPYALPATQPTASKHWRHTMLYNQLMKCHTWKQSFCRRSYSYCSLKIWNEIQVRQVWLIPLVDEHVGSRCDPSLTRAMPERFTDEFLVIKRYTNLLLLLLYHATMKPSTTVATRPLAGVTALCFLQCFYTVAWVTGMASGLWKPVPPIFKHIRPEQMRKTKMQPVRPRTRGKWLVKWSYVGNSCLAWRLSNAVIALWPLTETMAKLQGVTGASHIYTHIGNSWSWLLVYV